MPPVNCNPGDRGSDCGIVQALGTPPPTGTGTTVPAVPTGVNASSGNTSVTISWNAVTGATSYNIYWTTVAGVTIALGTKIPSVTSPYTHTGLTPVIAYYYIVTAVNSAGESSASAEVNATPYLSCTTCKMYVTNSGYRPGTDFTSAITADIHCNTNTAKPAGGGTYKALIVDQTTRIGSILPNAGDGQINWVLKPNTNYYRSDGTTLIGTTDSVALLGFPLSVSPHNTATQHWTGLNADWTTNVVGNCNNWTSFSPISGVCGDGSFMTVGILNGRPSVTCNQSPTGQQLLCVEQ